LSIFEGHKSVVANDLNILAYEHPLVVEAKLFAADCLNPIRTNEGFFLQWRKSALDMSNICSEASTIDMLLLGYMILPL
jgi:hypothetical protein